jgi:hypothetical protein
LPDDWEGYPLRKDYANAEFYKGIKNKHIIMLDNNRQIIMEFESSTKAKEFLKVSISAITQALVKKTKCKGFKWEYKTV